MNTAIMADLRRKVNAKLQTYQTALGQRVTTLTAAQNAQAAHADAQTALALAQTVAKAVQTVAHDRVASIVTQSLKTVFNNPYEFTIEFVEKRGRTEAVLAFTRGGMSVDPMTGVGLGVVDVAAFALRLSCLMLSQPPLRRVLIMDEPFKWVSVDRRDRVRELLIALSHELGVQFIMVTHQPELRVGKVVEL